MAFIDKLKNVFNSDSPNDRELRKEREFEEYYQNRFSAYHNFILVKLANRFDKAFVLAIDGTDKLIRILETNSKDKVFKAAIYTDRIIHFSLNNGTHRFHPDHFPKEFNSLGMMIKFQDSHGLFDEWIIKICEEKDNLPETKRNHLLNQALTLIKFIGYDKLFDENKYDEYVEQIASWKEKNFNKRF